MKKYLPHILFTLFIILSIFISFDDNVSTYFERQLQTGGLAAVFFFIFILIISTVIAPLSSLTLVPLFARLYDPLSAAIASIIGWYIGSIIAFIIARYFSETLLEKVVKKEDMQKYAKFIPEKNQLISITMLRIFIPVDILSYALGFLSRVPIGIYSIATFIGLIPFALIFSYGGDSLLRLEPEAILKYGILGAIIVIMAYYLYRIFSKNDAQK